MVAGLAAVGCAGCVEELPPLSGVTSIQVEIQQPQDPGAPDRRLDDSARTIQFSLRLLGADGEIARDFSGQVDLLVHHLGSLSPPVNSGRPLAFVDVVGGELPDAALSLPHVFGPAFLWAEHRSGPAPTLATGTSAALWFRDPYLSDISTPEDESSSSALERSPLEGKQVVVHESRYGARGRLVVTGSYAQGYTVSDVRCADDNGAPPCVAGDYDHVFVFTFSRPEAVDRGGVIRAGHAVAEVSGGISEFNGLTEVGFPRTVLADPDPDLGRVPEPVVIDPAWLGTRIELERLEAALVAIEGATMCPLDEDYDTYNQWKLDLGRGCDDPINVISQGQVAEFAPEPHVGQRFSRVVGTLRPVNIGTFHVWIIFPRAIGDIAL